MRGFSRPFASGHRTLPGSLTFARQHLVRMGESSIGPEEGVRIGLFLLEDAADVFLPLIIVPSTGPAHLDTWSRPSIKADPVRSSVKRRSTK